jgi:hypothetical protein
MVLECQASGMKIQPWCEARGIDRNRYYYWLKRVREASCREITEHTAQMPANADSPVFAEVRQPACGSSPAIMVQISDIGVEIHNGAEAGVIECTLRVLRDLC